MKASGLQGSRGCCLAALAAVLLHRLRCVWEVSAVRDVNDVAAMDDGCYQAEEKKLCCLAGRPPPRAAPHSAALRKAARERLSSSLFIAV